MRNVLLVLGLFYISFLHAQSEPVWRFSKTGDNFDGITNTARVRAISQERVNREPSLVLIYSPNQPSSLVFYFEGRDWYFPDSTRIQFYFDNEKTVYEVSNIGFGGNKLLDGSYRNLVMNTFKSNTQDWKQIGIVEILNSFKSHSYVYFKITTNMRQKYYTFSLKGSSQAINNTLSGL